MIKTTEIKDCGTSEIFGQADIEKGKTIRLYGTRWPKSNHPAPFDKTFKIGDTVIVGSYNLVYTGIITNIGEKTITCVEHKGSSHETIHRMKLEKFAWRNWNLDLDSVAARNADTMQAI